MAQQKSKSKCEVTHRLMSAISNPYHQTACGR